MTIADFRNDSGPSIRKVCRESIAFCHDIDLLDASVVAIDGSKFKTVNAKSKSFTRGKLKRRLGEIDAAIARYLAELDRADEVLEKTGTTVPEARLSRMMRTSNAGAAGRFEKADFIYEADRDAYRCPAGEWLTYHFTSGLDGKLLRSYPMTACES